MINKISNKIKNLFVADIVSDRFLPRYDVSEIKENVYYLEPNEKSIYKCELKQHDRNKDTILVQTSPNVGEKSILHLLDTACKTSKHLYDGSYSAMIYNPRSDMTLVYKAAEKYGLPPTFNRSGECYFWVEADFVHLNLVYFMPPPEFLGCLVEHKGGLGAFISYGGIKSVYLKDFENKDKV